MGSVVQPRTAVVVAALTAGALVAAPVIAPPADTVLRGFELTANPLNPYIDLVTNTFTNLGTIGAHWFEDPLPVVVQLFTNGFGHLQTTFDALGATVRSTIDGFINLPGQLETLFEAISSSDIVGAVGQTIIIVLSAFPVLGLIDRLVAIPIEMVGNVVSAADAVLHALQVPVGLALFTALQAAFSEVGTLVHDVIDDVSKGDLLGALGSLIGAPGQLLDALLNSESPGMAGLLAPFQDLDQSGFVDALVNYLPRAVAESIGAAYSPIEGALPPDLGGFDAADSGDPGALLPDL
ncbi:hypothetical protein [Mycolicibacter minnesotensis]